MHRSGSGLKHSVDDDPGMQICKQRSVEAAYRLRDDIKVDFDLAACPSATCRADLKHSVDDDPARFTVMLARHFWKF